MARQINGKRTVQKNPFKAILVEPLKILRTGEQLNLYPPQSLSPSSGKDLSHNMAMDIRQAALDTVVIECQALMIKSQQVQHRCMKIVPGHRILLRLPTNLVSCAIRNSRP